MGERPVFRLGSGNCKSRSGVGESSHLNLHLFSLDPEGPTQADGAPRARWGCTESPPHSAPQGARVTPRLARTLFWLYALLAVARLSHVVTQSSSLARPATGGQRRPESGRRACGGHVDSSARRAPQQGRDASSEGTHPEPLPRQAGSSVGIFSPTLTTTCKVGVWGKSASPGSAGPPQTPASVAEPGPRARSAELTCPGRPHRALRAQDPFAFCGSLFLLQRRGAVLISLAGR